MRLKRENGTFDQDVVGALLRASILLDLNQRFDDVLDALCRGDHAASRAFARVREEYRRGMPLKRALFGLEERTGTVRAARTAEQLAFVYAHAGRTRKNAGAPLRQLASEFLATDRMRAREYAAKLSLYTIFFCAIAVMVPVFSLIYFLVLPATPFSQGAPPLPTAGVFWLVVAAFPLLDIAALAFWRHQAPAFLK